MEKPREYLICLILSVPFLLAALLSDNLGLLAVPVGASIISFALSILYTHQSEGDRFTLFYIVSTAALLLVFLVLLMEDVWIQTILIALVIVGTFGLWLILNRLLYPSYLVKHREKAK
jgi:fatty acid desaturase